MSDDVYLEALQPGQQVVIGPSRDMAAEIVSVTFDGNFAFKYEVAWFLNGKRETAWMTDAQFDTVGDRATRRIGFVQEIAER